jgi:REP element-mobilizing transposase RayT
VNTDLEAGRKRPAHMPPVERHNEPIIIFLTVCSKGRRPIFAFPDAVDAILRAWRQTTSWLVGRYVIMPDHIHLFCAPGVLHAESLKHWVQYWKSIASKNWPRATEQPIWQRDFWDRQLRRQESYSAKWQYVLANPVRAGLIASPEEWPFQGELNMLRW